jgi:hypothetical protein
VQKDVASNEMDHCKPGVSVLFLHLFTKNAYMVIGTDDHLRKPHTLHADTLNYQVIKLSSYITDYQFWQAGLQWGIGRDYKGVGNIFTCPIRLRL